MLLAVDIGNSNLTLGLVRDGEVTGTRRATTPRHATADEIRILVDGLLGLEDLRLRDVDGAVVASVVPLVGLALASAVASIGLPLLDAAVGNVPIPVRVDQPSEVGADRLVNALAAGRLYGTPAIVVDFGTATTLDVVAPDGAFIGGAIAPGLELGLEALAARTARLPRVEALRPEQAIGRDTVSAIRSGAVFGHLGLVRELLERVRAELAAEAPERPIAVILTGGVSQAPWIADLPGVDAVDPDLTLEGLAILAAEAPRDAWTGGVPGRVDLDGRLPSEVATRTAPRSGTARAGRARVLERRT